MAFGFHNQIKQQTSHIYKIGAFSAHYIQHKTHFWPWHQNMLHCPGIEPGSQEWESCMIPLHQRRNIVKYEK